jgi:hypothetical protein|tara:strand:+ start:163 stop:570 length:408 start_codon:yes stop_codon:yes gene_type:complete
MLELSMIFSFKMKNCPCCSAINIFKVNGISYKNHFQSIDNFILKKVFNCRKCKAELGLFLDENNNDNLFWMDLLQCEDAYHKNLIDLQKNKDKCKGNNKKYNQIIKEISTIQNQIRLDKAKLKVKYKIKNLAMFI